MRLKSRFSFLFLFVLVLSAFAHAEDIAYIVKDTSKLNHDFLNAIGDLGLTVRVIDDDNIKSTNLSNYSMLLVGNDRFSNPTDIPVNDYPTLMSNEYYMDEWGWVSTISFVASSQPLQARNVLQNQITEGLPEVIQVYDECCYNGASLPMYYLSKERRPVKLKSVTSTMSDKLDAVIATSVKGTTLRNGKVSKAKGVFFGITESYMWTQDAEDLFKNSIMWVMNGPPKLIKNIPSTSFDEDTELFDAYDLSEYFFDKEGDEITYSITGNGHVKATIEGSIVTLYADTNWYGSESVKFVASDGEQTTESNTVTITVNSVNDDPVLQDLPDVTYVEKDYVDINATATDADGNTVSIMYSEPLNSQGDWQTELGDEGIYTITVEATDGLGGFDSKTFDLTVLPKVYINEFSLEGWVELYNPNDYDTDLDGWTLQSSSASITLDSIIGARDFLVYNLSLSANDRIVLKNNGYVTDDVSFGTYNDGNTADNAASPSIPKSAGRRSDGYDSNNDKFDFLIFDLHTKGLSNLADVTPPVVALVSPADGFVLTDSSRRVFARFSASDNKASNLDCELWMDAEGDFEPIATVNVRSGNQGTFTISDLEDRTYTWNVECFDGRNYAFAPTNYTLIVNVNDPPTIDAYSPEDLNPEVEENSTLEFTQESSDPEGLPLTYTWKVDNSVKSTEPSFNYTPGFFDSGTHRVILTVKDSGNLTDSVGWDVKVLNVNRKPYLVSEIPEQNFDEDTVKNLVLTGYFADEDNEPLTYKVVDEDISQVDCSIAYDKIIMNPAKDFNGDASCTILANDGIDDSDDVVINMVINPVNDAPVLVDNIPYQSWDEDTERLDAFNLNDYFDDVDSSDLTYDVTGNSNITVTIDDDGTVSFSQPADWYGVEYVRFVASDGLLSTQSNSVRLGVSNVNDIPEGLPIPDVVLDEDTTTSLDLTPYFTDKETTRFTYKVVDEDKSKVDCGISTPNLTVTPAPDFNGESVCLVVANDGTNDSEPVVVRIIVNPVNDIPTLKINIPSKTWNEDTSLDDAFDLDDYFYDVDEDVLTYSFSGNTNINIVIDSDNLVSFSQPADWFGSEGVTFTASDGISSVSSNVVTLTVNDVNEPPVLEEIPEQTIYEESNENYVTLNATDVDGSIVGFAVVEEDLNKVNCEISGNTLNLIGAKDFVGDASCTIKVTDDDGDIDTKTVLIHVLNINDAPVIDGYSPNYDPLIGDGHTQAFSVTYHDVDSDSNLSVSWYVDSALLGSGDTFNFTAPGKGTFEIKVVVSDSEFTVEKTWDLTATDCPITNKFDGSTTKFCELTQEQLADLDCVVIEKTGFGKIDFCGSKVDLTETIFLDKYIHIGPGFVAFDANALSAFAGKSATITMYNINSGGTPKIYYNSAFTIDPKEVLSLCPPDICYDINYDAGMLTFKVAHFSSFKSKSTEQQPQQPQQPSDTTCSGLGGYKCSSTDVCPTQWLTASDTSYCCAVGCIASKSNDSPGNNESFKNLDVCSNGTIGDLKVEIKEPDSGDDFKPGDEIEVEIKVKNNGAKDMDVNVKVVLFDKDDDELDSDSDDVDVDKGDSETLTFTLKVSDNADEDNDFMIFVKAYQDGKENEQCSESRVNIDIKREKHDVIIDEPKISPSTLSCENFLTISFTAENIGKNDEMMYFTVTDSSLGVDFRSDAFEVEEGDDVFKSMNFELPSNLTKGSYPLQLTLYFEDGNVADSETLNFNVVECVSISKEGIPIKSGVPAPEGLVRIDLLKQHFIVEQGASFSVPVRITNIGLKKATFNLGVSGLSYGKFLEADKITLNTGDASTAYVYVKTNDDALGKYSSSVDLKVDGLIVDSKAFTVEVIEPVELVRVGGVFTPYGLSLGTIVLIMFTIIAVIVIVMILAWTTYKPRR